MLSINDLIKQNELWMYAFNYYMIIINLLCYIIFGIDKRKAIKKERRIKESLFITLSLLGGAVGILIGMVTFKHKIRKKKFYIFVPLIYILNQIIELLLEIYIFH